LNLSLPPLSGRLRKRKEDSRPKGRKSSVRFVFKRNNARATAFFSFFNFGIWGLGFKLALVNFRG
jgi:hypothetical protein